MQELLLLPSVLAEALGPDAEVARHAISVEALLSPSDVSGLQLELVPATSDRPAIAMPRQALRDVLRGGSWEIERTGSAVSEVDRKAARTLNISIERLSAHARELWGRSLIEERNHRLAEPQFLNRAWLMDAAARKRDATRLLRSAEKTGDEELAKEAVTKLFRADRDMESGPPDTDPTHPLHYTSVRSVKGALRGIATRELIAELRRHLDSSPERSPSSEDPHTPSEEKDQHNGAH